MTVRASGPRILTPEQVAQHAYNAGFRGESLAIAVAVAKGESNHDAHAVGDDTRAKNPNWEGPGEQSTGLWQVHYRPSRDRGNPLRDPKNNLDPAHNARAAYSISSGGTKFSPWSVFTAGLHRKHLERARAAAASITGTASVPTTSTAPAVAGPPPRPVAVINLGGRLVEGELGDRFVGGTIDLTIDEVSQLTLEFLDRDLDLLAKYRAELRTYVKFMGLEWDVIAHETLQGPAVPHLQLTCLSAPAVRMKTMSGRPVQNQSPTQYMEMIAREAAMVGFRGQPSAVRDTVGPVEIDDNGIKRRETMWETGQRLAAELGYIAFESAGVYHFGKPYWFVREGETYTLEWQRHDLGTVEPGNLEALEMPRCKKAIGFPSGRHETTSISAEVPRVQGERLRPGHNLFAKGVPTFRGGGLIVTQVTWDLGNLVSPVSIAAEIPEQVEATGAGPVPAQPAAPPPPDTGEYQWPAQGRLSSPYGMRNGRLHAGIDIANSTGTPIYAARAGTVSRSARSDSYGEVIYIDHGGAETRYAHLSKRRVLTGARVAKGERIGDMGSTGRSTGPHLHFEVRRSGSPINPITVLPKR